MLLMKKSTGSGHFPSKNIILFMDMYPDHVLLLLLLLLLRRIPLKSDQ